MLVSGGDVATRGVIISTKMSCHATPSSSGQQQRQIDLAAIVDDRLSGFDHHFKLQAIPAARSVSFSSSSKRSARAETCSGIVIFGNVTTKFSGSWPSVFSNSVETKISSVRRLRSRNSSLKGLIRMPMNGGRVSFLSLPPLRLQRQQRARLLLRRADFHNHLQSQCENLQPVRAAASR